MGRIETTVASSRAVVSGGGVFGCSSVVLQLSRAGSSLRRLDGRSLRRAAQAAVDVIVGIRQPVSGTTLRLAVSPCSRAHAAKKAARRWETIRASLHGHPSTRQPRRPRSVTPWLTSWLSMARSPFFSEHRSRSFRAPMVDTLGLERLQRHRHALALRYDR